MKMSNGILGRTSKSIGNITCANWKGINYARTKVTPANPRSEAQTAWRAAFAAVVAFVKDLTGPWLNIYLDWQIKGMSGYNHVIKYGVPAYFESELMLDVNIMSGKLFPNSLDEPIRDGITNDLIVTWTENLGGLAKSTDKAIAACFSENTMKWYFGPSDKVRGDETMKITIDETAIASPLYVYLFFAQYSGTKLVSVSNNSKIAFVP